MEASTLPGIDRPARTAVRRFDNGFTVVVRERHASPVVAIVTHVRAGYLDEDDARVGISHVLEHMYFKGTPGRGPGEMARATKALGGYLNASTSYDHTRYYTVLPAHALAHGIDIQADALRNSLIDADELARELRVIIEEARRKLDTPGAFARESLYAALFDRHRMRRWRIGDPEQLALYTRDDVAGFYRTRYRPGAIVLAVAGAVDADEVFDLAERHYGDLPDVAAPPNESPAEPVRSGFRVRRLSADISRTHIEWGWRGRAASDPDTPGMDLLGIALGQGRASRLYREVREPGHALAVSSANFATRDIGVFGISAETRAGGEDAALHAVADAVRRLLRDGLEPAEVERARKLFGARMLHRLETVEGQASWLAEWQAIGDWRLGDEYLARADQVDARMLDELARATLLPQNATVLVYAPPAAPDLPDAETLADRLFEGPLPPAPAPPVSPVVIPAAGHVEFEREEDGVRFYRAEGARIIVQPRPGSGLASIVIALAGGGVHEMQADAGLTSLMMRISPKGTTTRAATDIAIATEALGGGVRAHAGADLFEWRMSVPSASVGEALVLLADVAFRPIFPQDAFELERRIALDDVAQVRDDMHRFPLSLMMGAAFPRHAYGFPLETLEASLRTADRSRVTEWHDRRMQAERWVIIVGDVDADAVARIAAACVPGQAAGPEPPRQPGPWPPKRFEVRALRDRAQTAITIGLPGPDRNHDDLYPLLLAGSAVGGLGGRAFEELRSKRSLAYTVNLRPIALRQAGVFIGYIATTPAREDEAREALLREMRRLAEDGVSEDELERARSYSLGAWDIRRQTTAAIASDLVGALVIGNGLVELREFADRVLAVTPDFVRTAAHRWLDPARAVIGVVRGRLD